MLEDFETRLVLKLNASELAHQVESVYVHEARGTIYIAMTTDRGTVRTSLTKGRWFYLDYEVWDAAIGAALLDIQMKYHERKTTTKV